MAEAERLLRERGCPKVNLLVRSSNADVLAFYARLGYGQDDVVSLGKRLIHDQPPDPAIERASSGTLSRGAAAAYQASGNRLQELGTPVKVSASVRSGSASHQVIVSTGESAQSLMVPSKPSGQGSSVNGGEFLVLALATCYCNDLYREAARLGIPIESVDVEASAEFPGIGLPASEISYRARVASPRATPQQIAELLRVTDGVAEVHNTVRAGVPVTLETL
jgi:organic hydroperoxide reductase OsmC/OhrA